MVFNELINNIRLTIAKNKENIVNTLVKKVINYIFNKNNLLNMLNM